MATATRDPAATRVRLTGRELFELAEIYFVYDPTDAGDTGRVARSLGLHEGVVCVEIPPRDSVPLGALALGILASLGKDLDREKQLTQRDAWRLARVWLNADEIQALIVIGADQLDAATWHQLSDVCRQTPTPSVILIQHQTGLDRTQRELLDRERAFTSVPPATFHDWSGRFEAACEHASTAAAELTPAPKKRRFPSVPDDEIPYFRAACRDALSKPDFRVVDDTYREAYDSTWRWLDGRRHLSEDRVGAFLAGALRRMDVNEQLTRLRGSQVAFLRHWWLLKVDVEALAAAHHVDPPAELDDDMHDQLHAYVQPKTSALAALAIATGLPPGRLAMLNADQIYAGRRWDREYNAVDLGDRKLAVTAASLFLRAHYLDRELRDQPVGRTAVYDKHRGATDGCRGAAAAAARHARHRTTARQQLVLTHRPTARPLDAQPRPHPPTLMTPVKAQSPTPVRQVQAELRRLRLQADAVLDTATLRRLRLQAGYSTRRFARALGVSASTIRGLEEGSNHDQLPLTLVARLAELLGVAPQELFAHSAHEAVDPSTDDRTIEAALQSMPGVVAISELARALEWKLERTRRALDVLEKRLQTTGARLHRNGWQQCAIRPATQHLADDQQQSLQRIGPRDRGLNHITARLLLAATRGELDERWFKTASNSERVALQSLLKQRVLLTLPGQTEIIPAPDVIYGLDPDLREPPALGALSPVGRRPEDHPGRADHATSTERATEQLATPD